MALEIAPLEPAIAGDRYEIRHRRVCTLAESRREAAMLSPRFQVR
jgi:hypothetical protein